jgi:hypothetical protein
VSGTSGDLSIANAEVGMGVGPEGQALYPTIYAGEVRIPNDGFETIVRQVLREPLDLTHLTLALVSCRLIDGGAELILRAQRGRLEQTVTARAELSPAGDGALRVTIGYLRVGFFAASWLLEYVLGAVNRQPGMRQSGPKSVDVDIATLLQARGVPLHWQAGVERVDAHADALTIAFR